MLNLQFNHILFHTKSARRAGKCCLLCITIQTWPSMSERNTQKGTRFIAIILAQISENVTYKWSMPAVSSILVYRHYRQFIFLFLLLINSVNISYAYLFLLLVYSRFHSVYHNPNLRFVLCGCQQQSQ